MSSRPTRWQVVWSDEELAVRSLWAYAYQIMPSQPSRHLGRIRTLLKEETVAARTRGCVWSGRLVLERDATYILIVSDDARRRNHPINRRLEAELERLEGLFAVTEPMEVAGQAVGFEWLASDGGNGGSMPGSVGS